MTQSPNQGDIKQEKSQGISRLHKFLWDLAYHYADGPVERPSAQRSDL